eukprot:TRINITY_DN1232_c0_g1_i1.p1 TRINITY_DN1232_c0_g1~~TRINITY_DN1232_c0_g1_i1.p1  ORF type:complete len:168 (-),score=98.46 TRINITY_DN1232_c0_g1_i1:95-574(-)
MQSPAANTTTTTSCQKKCIKGCNPDQKVEKLQRRMAKIQAKLEKARQVEAQEVKNEAPVQAPVSEASEKRGRCGWGKRGGPFKNMTEAEREEFFNRRMARKVQKAAILREEIAAKHIKVAELLKKIERMEKQAQWAEGDVARMKERREMWKERQSEESQ